jgi:hypothetical protein
MASLQIVLLVLVTGLSTGLAALLAAKLFHLNG